MYLYFLVYAPGLFMFLQPPADDAEVPVFSGYMVSSIYKSSLILFVLGKRWLDTEYRYGSRTGEESRLGLPILVHRTIHGENLLQHFLLLC